MHVDPAGPARASRARRPAGVPRERIDGLVSAGRYCAAGVHGRSARPDSGTLCVAQAPEKVASARQVVLTDGSLVWLYLPVAGVLQPGARRSTYRRSPRDGDIVASCFF